MLLQNSNKVRQVDTLGCMFAFEVGKREGWEGVKGSDSSVLGFISEVCSKVVRILPRGMKGFVVVYRVLDGFLDVRH